MPEEIRPEDEIVVSSEPIEPVEEPIPVVHDIAEPAPPTGDAEKGALLGGVGGLVTGAIAGAGAGPAGSVIGAVVGGVVGAVASGAAVAAVDRIDDDSKLSGLPDDMSMEEPEEREPVVVDTSAPPVVVSPDAPLGLGVQETVIATEPAESLANTVDVNSEAAGKSQSYAYADEPEEDRP